MLKKYHLFILNLHSFKMVLLFILMPLIVLTVEFIAKLVSFFGGFHYTFSMSYIVIGVMVFLYASWLYSIAVYLNKRCFGNAIAVTWFKIALGIFIGYFLIIVIINCISIFSPDLYIPESVFGPILTLYTLVTFFSYGYLSLFTAKVIKSVELNTVVSMSSSLEIAPLIWVFPIGIPVLQSKIKRLVKSIKL